MPAAQPASKDAGNPAQPAANTPVVSSQQQAAPDATAPDSVPASGRIPATAAADRGALQPALAAAAPKSDAAPSVSGSEQPASGPAAPDGVPAPATAPATNDAHPTAAAAASGVSASPGPTAAPGGDTTPPAAPALTVAQCCSVLGDVTAASGTAAGCRLARLLLVKLGNDPGGRSRDSIVADRLEIPKSHAHALLGTGTLERSYIAVADSGAQQLVTFRRGTLLSTHGFAPFREAAGIPRGSHISVAACHGNPEHLHIALVAAPSALQPGGAVQAAQPLPAAPLADKRSCTGVQGVFVGDAPPCCESAALFLT